MNKELIKIINKLNGNILIIGNIDDNLEKINKNPNIIECDIININDNKKEKINKFKDKFNKKEQKINIKKLKKIYNKKSIDYILCDYELIKKYMRFFVKDSVYLNKNKLYLYGINIKEVKEIINKYKRYDVLVKPTIKDDYFFIEIDNKNSKNNIIKDFIYFIIDTITYITDFIGDILIN